MQSIYHLPFKQGYQTGRYFRTKQRHTAGNEELHVQQKVKEITERMLQLQVFLKCREFVNSEIIFSRIITMYSAITNFFWYYWSSI